MFGKVEATRLSRPVSKMRKWKNTFPGHLECCSTEWTAAIDPRRYSTSRVIATWTRPGLQTPGLVLPRVPHSSALVNSGALLKDNEDRGNNSPPLSGSGP
ncbi:hypothetical protein MLD38_012358 [Melastoma candidum]|uniref:Uncharacterized protein n=1 Tax=Melastoma candidum TaxID=119954 RepID=A0ACB9R7U6_9MYRT|nr:hypothetical protein MLD38_012358 [Melastoma candidum]